MMHRNRLNGITEGRVATFLPKSSLIQTPTKTTMQQPNSFFNMAKRADEMRENRVLVNKMVDINFNTRKFHNLILKYNSNRSKQVQHCQHLYTEDEGICLLDPEEEVGEPHFARQPEAAHTAQLSQDLLPDQEAGEGLRQPCEH